MKQNQNSYNRAGAVAPAAPCSACGGSGLGKPMYNPEIDKTQRDRCYTCKGSGTKPSYTEREAAYESIGRIARENRLIIAAAGGVLVIGHPDEMAKVEAKRNPSTVMDLWEIAQENDQDDD